MQNMSVGARVIRAAVASVCAATLTVASPARAAAQPAEGEEAPAARADAPAPLSEDLPPQAEKHVLKAIQHFQNSAFSDAEEEFKRASFFAPKWRPLHFNLGVVAEAQGKIGTAVTEYKAFRPYASPDEQMVVDQRIDELGRRKGRIGGAYKRQIALTAGAMSLGVLSMGGAATLFVFNSKYKKDAAGLDDQAGSSDPNGDGEENGPGDIEASADLSSRADALDKRRAAFVYGGIYLAIFGLLLVGYSFVPLRNAIRSKRQLDGLALGPTRLKWNGGAGMTLRF